jgi:ABC-type Fe3+-hydroxamate transport system substrate-binding protein
MAPVPPRHLGPLRWWLLAISVTTVAALASVHGAANRVVSVIPAATEMLFAMGAGSHVVAVGSYDHFPPEAARLPRVGALFDPNVERILALRPDLVVMYSTQTELKAQLQRAGIPFYAYTHHGLPDVLETIRTLGARVGFADNANALAARLDAQFGDIRRQVAGRRRPRTLLVFGREHGALKNIDASGGEGFLHDMLEIAGGDDILGDLHRQSVSLSTEMILARAPEVIIELHYAAGDVSADADLRAWDALPSVPAVRTHRIYTLHGEQFVIPGPRVALAIEQMARTLHPEAFK